MRPVDGFNRRYFLTRILTGLWTFALTWVPEHAAPAS